MITLEKIKSEAKLERLLNPFIDMEVHQLEEQPLSTGSLTLWTVFKRKIKIYDQIRSRISLNERYQQVENAEKLYQLFYSG